MSEEDIIFEPFDCRVVIGGLHTLQFKDQGLLTCTTGEDPTRDGIIVTPNITLKGITSGTFFYDQICHYQRLRIVTALNPFEFCSAGRRLRDSPSDADSHMERYFIEHGQAVSARSGIGTPAFSDCPYMALLPHFQEVHYEINFETLLQYGRLNLPERPIFRFTWWLRCIVKNVRGVWRLESCSNVFGKHSKNCCL